MTELVSALSRQMYKDLDVDGVKLRVGLLLYQHTAYDLAFFSALVDHRDHACGLDRRIEIGQSKMRSSLDLVLIKIRLGNRGDEVA